MIIDIGVFESAPGLTLTHDWANIQAVFEQYVAAWYRIQ